MTLIDKDELLKVLRQRYEKLKQWYEKASEDAKAYASAAIAECFEIGNIVKEQPTVDAVPVVRCKNCGWYYCTKGESGWCSRLKSVCWDNWYCVHGWRKKDKDETD